MLNYLQYIKAAIILLLIAGYGNLSLNAQSPFQSSEIIPYDIFEKNVGPSTTPVKMTGYVDTEDYHEIRYVSVNNGSDDGDGSQSKPWADIRYALDHINDASLTKRYAVLVAEGVYGGGTVYMKEFIHLYGGFNSDNWKRDIESYSTVVDGNKKGRAMIGADNAKVDGFVIRNGLYRGKGGGILCDGTSPVISNNIISNNKTLTPDNWEPEFIHELANDGGSIAALNGAGPHITNNLFVNNQTETGRGAGIAAHNRSTPLIAYNVFLNNTSGINDSMRSSDGGAISSAYHSSSDIYYNVILGNRAENKNDGGGIFTEKWSSLHIGGNLLVDNFSSDDGGGIYLSGQTHHYVTKPDPVYPEERYLNKLKGNYLIGNSIDSDAPPGAFRFTNDTRVEYDRNISYLNDGGLDFRKSMVKARNNIMMDIVTIRESDYTTYLHDNLILGSLVIDAPVEQVNNQVEEKITTPYDDQFNNIFIDDQLSLVARNGVYDSDKYVTKIRLAKPISEVVELKNRVVKIDDSWSVIYTNDQRSITVWGDHSKGRQIEVLTTFRMNTISDHYGEKVGLAGK
ncbi:MAG: right-handed parallel beta-helix repeat-containing protein [Balneolales bacterium]